jgi:hypothetical protein
MQVEAVREAIQRSVQSPGERGALEVHAAHVSEALKGPLESSATAYNRMA